MRGDKRRGRPKIEGRKMVKSFALPPDVVEWLEAESERLGVPQGHIVADALREKAAGGSTDDPKPPVDRVAVAKASHPAVGRGFEDKSGAKAKPFAPQPKPTKGK